MEKRMNKYDVGDIIYIPVRITGIEVTFEKGSKPIINYDVETLGYHGGTTMTVTEEELDSKEGQQ